MLSTITRKTSTKKLKCNRVLLRHSSSKISIHERLRWYRGLRYLGRRQRGASLWDQISSAPPRRPRGRRWCGARPIIIARSGLGWPEITVANLAVVEELRKQVRWTASHKPWAPASHSFPHLSASMAVTWSRMRGEGRAQTWPPDTEATFQAYSARGSGRTHFHLQLWPPEHHGKDQNYRRPLDANQAHPESRSLGMMPLWGIAHPQHLKSQLINTIERPSPCLTHQSSIYCWRKMFSVFLAYYNPKFRTSLMVWWFFKKTRKKLCLFD
jgi:hypothetical protein